MNEASLVSECRTVRVAPELEPLYRDAYRALGWSVAEGPRQGRTATLLLERDPHIRNRQMLVELQRKAEHALAAIARWERSTTATAAGATGAVGVAGAILLAGSVITLNHGSLGWAGLLGAFGLIGWMLCQTTYARVKANRSARLAPRIERQLGVVREAREQAGHLIY